MILKKIFILCLTFTFHLYYPNITEANSNDTLMKIEQANEAYHEKKYQLAIKIYKNLIEQGHNNGYLYYNLGNTHMRLGNKGGAIFNYLKAKEQLPRNENLDANLRYAISQTIDKLPPKQNEGIQDILFWIESISLKEHLKLIILLNAIFWSISIGFIYHKNSSWKFLKITSMTILLIIFFSASLKFYSQTQQNFGVVLKSTLDIKSGPDINDVTLFQLHEGAIILVGNEVEDWARITLEKGKSGWAKKTNIVY